MDTVHKLIYVTVINFSRYLFFRMIFWLLKWCFENGILKEWVYISSLRIGFKIYILINKSKEVKMKMCKFVAIMHLNIKSNKNTNVLHVLIFAHLAKICKNL